MRMIKIKVIFMLLFISNIAYGEIYNNEIISDNIIKFSFPSMEKLNISSQIKYKNLGGINTQRAKFNWGNINKVELIKFQGYLKILKDAASQGKKIRYRFIESLLERKAMLVKYDLLNRMKAIYILVDQGDDYFIINQNDIKSIPIDEYFAKISNNYYEKSDTTKVYIKTIDKEITLDGQWKMESHKDYSLLKDSKGEEIEISTNQNEYRCFQALIGSPAKLFIQGAWFEDVGSYLIKTLRLVDRQGGLYGKCNMVIDTNDDKRLYTVSYISKSAYNKEDITFGDFIVSQISYRLID